MLMQVTVDNNDALRLLFLVDEVSEGRFQTTAPHTARGFDTPVHHSPLGGCLLLTHIHPYRYIINVSIVCHQNYLKWLFSLWGIFFAQVLLTTLSIFISISDLKISFVFFVFAIEFNNTLYFIAIQQMLVSVFWGGFLYFLFCFVGQMCYKLKMKIQSLAISNLNA